MHSSELASVELGQLLWRLQHVIELVEAAIQYVAALLDGMFFGRSTGDIAERLEDLSIQIRECFELLASLGNDCSLLSS